MKKVIDTLNPENVKKVIKEQTGPFAFLYDKTILIVDDEEAILDMLSHFLASKGFKVFTAQDSKSALAMAIDKTPDLVITDIMMPYFSGHDFMNALNKKLSDKRPPVIMITSAPTGENVKKAKLSGVNAFIPKPIDFQTLFIKVATELKKVESKTKIK
jgi:DNA-binding response OmpR family regulator